MRPTECPNIWKICKSLVRLIKPGSEIEKLKIFGGYLSGADRKSERD
jgi:hypothetical protein